MAARTINGIDELRSLVGEHLGYSDWVEVTQEMVNQFADATGDHQWIHVDVERAKAGPFGAPIAHGYLTLSLGPRLAPEIYSVSGVKMGVNYGADRIRFPAPVPVGSKLRLGAKLLEVTDIDGGAQMKMEFSFEVEGSEQAVLCRRGPLPRLHVDAAAEGAGAPGVPNPVCTSERRGPGMGPSPQQRSGTAGRPHGPGA